jgi:hypothetical protein
VHDSSKKETLKKVLRERLSKSKVMFLILSHETNYDRGLLNYEIEKALYTYQLPIIIAYPKIGEARITSQWSTIEKRWPKALKQRLNDKTRVDLSCLHIHFRKDLVKRALNHMTVHDKRFIGTRLVYKN